MDIPLDLVPDFDLARPLTLPRIVDDGSESDGEGPYDGGGPLSADIISSRWLDCRSVLPSPAACGDDFGLALESASEDISTASPSAAQTLFPRPHAADLTSVGVGFKSSFGLVNTHMVLGSPGVGAFLRRWALGDASDHPFFCIVADGATYDGGWCPLQVAVYGNATTIERFVPGSVAPEDLDEAEASCRTLFLLDNARRASAPSIHSKKVGSAAAARSLMTGLGDRYPSAQRHSIALGELSVVERWIQSIDPVEGPSSTETEDFLVDATRRHSTSEDLGCTRVWGSVEIHLNISDGQPGIVHSYVRCV